MKHRASESVQMGDDQLVAGAVARGEGLVELGPAGLGTAGMVEVDVCGVRTGAGQGHPFGEQGFGPRWSPARYVDALTVSHVAGGCRKKLRPNETKRYPFR